MNFHEIAFQLVPLGSRPLVIPLREEIAETLKRVVAESIETYRKDNLPAEILRIDAEVKRNHADLNKRLTALERERVEFKKVVAGHLELLTAIEKWIEWCEGHGETESQPELWADVKTAWEHYRLLKVAV